MDATSISIPKGDVDINTSNKPKILFFFCSISSSVISSIRGFPGINKNAVHSIKVGTALAVVSLLYLLDPLYKQVGENAMWAIMTVVVVFEFSAGGTVSKGINRGIGTIVGAGLGCLVALLADKFGRVGNRAVVGTSVFLIGAAATYFRLVPIIRRRYDYGVMIFILTFNLVAVSGLRAHTVMKITESRLSTIGMGFAICVFISLLIFPIWASDQLHQSTATKFLKLAFCIQECAAEYFPMSPHEERSQTRSSAVVNECNMVLLSKSHDESLVNFAKWEPWHGKFGLTYPWEKYLEVGDTLRELAAIILTLQLCNQSPRQQPESTILGAEMKEETIKIALALACILKELGESISEMKLCRAKPLLVSKIATINEHRLSVLKCSNCSSTDNGSHQLKKEDMASISFVFLLMEMAEKVEALAESVESFGMLACFPMKKPDAADP